MRLFRSVYGKKGSHRSPRSSVKRGLTFQESCANNATLWKRVLRYSPAPCVKSLNLPTRKSAKESPVNGEEGPLNVKRPLPRKLFVTSSSPRPYSPPIVS